MTRRLGGSAALLLALACTPSDPGTNPVRVTVPPGATFRAVTDTVAAHGLIASKLWFRALARVTGADRTVKAGIYDLPSAAGAWRTLQILKEGRVATIRLTVPEGLTLLELAGLVESRLGIPSDSLLALAADSTIRKVFGSTEPSLEGFLLPETYTLPLPVTGEMVLRAMTAEFERQWDSAWDRRLDSIGLNRHQVLTLASIVEGEARHDDERATIAGVYTNRVRRDMPLQADPTIQYAIQLKTGERKPRLLFKDLEIDSPYNTYLHAGLPPGPVNSPGLESIRAALYPADVPWLYFVAGPDGHHVFSRTLIDHNRAIAEIRRLGGAAGRENGR